MLSQSERNDSARRFDLSRIELDDVAVVRCDYEPVLPSIKDAEGVAAEASEAGDAAMNCLVMFTFEDISFLILGISEKCAAHRCALDLCP